jgi:hypothetical protein
MNKLLKHGRSSALANFRVKRRDLMAKTKKSGSSIARPESDRICNVVPSRNTENDWSFENAMAAGAMAAAPPAAPPASVDLRAAWWDIGNQESTGSCVGWGSTDGLARFHFVKAGKLDKKARLSPRFTWMASNETDEFTSAPETMIEGAGTSLKAALDILRKYGAVPETLLPFHIATNMFLGDEKTFFATAATRKIASYVNMQRNFASWRAWLASNGPILVALNVDATWDNATATKGKLDTFQRRFAEVIVSQRSDTPPTIGSSSVTPGARPGATRALPTPAKPISMRPSSMKVTA